MKLWYQSRTLWVNVLAIIGIVVVSQLHLFDAQSYAEITTILLALLNLVLRLDGSGIAPSPKSSTSSSSTGAESLPPVPPVLP